MDNSKVFAFGEGPEDLQSFTAAGLEQLESDWFTYGFKLGLVLGLVICIALGFAATLVWSLAHA